MTEPVWVEETRDDFSWLSGDQPHREGVQKRSLVPVNTGVPVPSFDVQGRAICACGWDGPWRASMSETAADHAGHTTTVTTTTGDRR
jgi:hypothetical protein